MHTRARTGLLIHMNSALHTIGILAPHPTKECEQLQHELEQSCIHSGLRHFSICRLEELTCLMPEILICLGGDGTILSIAEPAARAGCVVAGINMGHLGFLSSCGREESRQLIHAIAQQQYTVEERALLQVTHSGAEDEPRLALNEVALMRAQTGKMVDVDVELNGELLNRYHADGVLVATPTGSTAYSLSAGGPLLWPNARVMCLTPICPHSLTNRSVVLPEDVEITIRPRERRGRSGESLIYSLDGHTTRPIGLDDTLTIRKSALTLRLLSLPGSNYATRLRAKLGW